MVLARYFPSLPLFNRLVLKPEPWTGSEADDPTAKPPLEGYESLAFLIGETGRTTTVLRPTGKARFGELLVDVTADGFYIEPDSLVEVVDVQGTRVIVKPRGLRRVGRRRSLPGLGEKSAKGRKKVDLSRSVGLRLERLSLAGRVAGVAARDPGPRGPPRSVPDRGRVPRPPPPRPVPSLTP